MAKLTKNDKGKQIQPKLGISDVSGSFLDWQKIEDEVADMYKLPVAVNTNGLKFKFYAEFLSGASWMRKHILGNDRLLGTVILTMKNKLKAVRCDNCKFFNHTDKPRYDGVCMKDNEYTAEHRVCNKLPTDEDRRNAKLRRNG